jgi:hypothetical protein
MAEPWDVPPFPDHGDQNADDTYKMVGRALSEWEELEYRLAHLYAQIIGRPSQIAALREYGKGRIFADRIAGLETAAEAYFIRNPRQNSEAELACIAEVARRLADRRNEIAHGIVRPLQWIQRPIPDRLIGQPLEYALVPPLYTRRKLDEKNRPKYIYTANELMQFWLAFSDLSQEALRLQRQIAHTRPS